MALAALVLLPCASRAAAQPLAPPAVPAAPPRTAAPAPAKPAAAPAVQAAPLAAAPLSAPPSPAPAKPALLSVPSFPVAVAFAPVVTERAGEVTVGDRVEALLTVRLPAGQLSGAPRFPVWGESWGDVEVREKAPAQKVSEQGGTVVYRQRLLLTPWKPGRLVLPPAVVAVPLAERTVEARTAPDLALDVVSVLPRSKPGETAPAPKAPAPMTSLPLGSRFGWTAAGLAAACAAAAALLVWQQRRRAAGLGAAALLPPYEALLAEIDRLGAQLESGAGSTLRVHTDLSRALRAYLGRTLAFPAAESTTAEIQRQLTSRRLPSALPRRAVEILRGCDLVKFARQEVGRERSRERLDAARTVAAELERYVHPPEEAAAADAIESPFEKAG